MLVSPRTTYWPVRDKEAFDERLAILLEADDCDLTAAHRIANEHSIHTRYSIVATAALQGDWTGLWDWCAELCRRDGDEVARSILAEVQRVVAIEREWLDTLDGK